MGLCTFLPTICHINHSNNSFNLLFLFDLLKNVIIG